MFKRLCSAALVFGLAATAPPVLAQAQPAFCAPRAVIVQKLTDDFGEALEAAGLQSAQRVVEVWASEGTGTWTIFFTLANGTSCVVASGSNWNQKTGAVLPQGILG